MKNILLPLAIAITLLNSGVNPVLAQAKSKWSAKELEGTINACIKRRLGEPGNKFTPKSANVYCSCTLNVASSRYTIQDFAKNRARYRDQLKKEGVIQKCTQSALAVK
jgi:hypothetical protein